MTHMACEGGVILTDLLYTGDGAHFLTKRMGTNQVLCKGEPNHIGPF